MKPTIAMLEDWVKGIELHAQKNYEKDGWDYIVECWEFKEILKEIKGCVVLFLVLGPSLTFRHQEVVCFFTPRTVRYQQFCSLLVVGQLLPPG